MNRELRPWANASPRRHPSATDSVRCPVKPQDPARTLETVKMGDPVASFLVERLCQRLHTRDVEQPSLRQSTLRKPPLVR